MPLHFTTADFFALVAANYDQLRRATRRHGEESLLKDSLPSVKLVKLLV
jgi:hypothetical protein